MPTIPDWFESSDAWDRVIIGGRALPGLSKADATAGRKIDVKSVRGKDGARLRDGGYTPAKVTVECIVWESADLGALSEALERLQPRGGASRAPVQIAHPALAAIGISQVYVESISAPVLDKGKLTTKLTFVEWTETPPTTNVSTATTATPTNTPGNESSAFEQQEERTNSRNRPGANPPAAVVAGTRT